MSKKRNNFDIKFFDADGNELPFSGTLRQHITRTSTINAWTAHQVVRKLEIYIEEDVDNKVANALDDLLEYPEAFTICIDMHGPNQEHQGGVIFSNCTPVEVVLNAFDNRFNTLVENPVLGDFGTETVTNRLSLTYDAFKRKSKS